jgi:hypothetical protein
MDISVNSLIKLVSEVGPIGLVIFFWWYDNRRIWIVFDQHKQDLAAERAQSAERTAGILEKYRADMSEQREMYRANASLCRDYESIASDLRDIVSLNIQKMTQLDDAVRGNQFCPVMRIREKKTVGMVSKLASAQDGGG